MRTFKHFPAETTCLLCGKSTDGECVLAGIDGTGDGRIEKAVPIHVKCISLRYNENAGIFYQRAERQSK